MKLVHHACRINKLLFSFLPFLLYQMSFLSTTVSHGWYNWFAEDLPSWSTMSTKCDPKGSCPWSSLLLLIAAKKQVFHVVAVFSFFIEMGLVCLWIYRFITCQGQALMGWSTSSDPLAPKIKSNSRGGPKVLFTAGFLPILNNFMSSGRREGGDLKLIPSRCTFLRSAQSPLDQVWATHTQVCFGGPFQLRFKERYCSTMGFYTESRLRSVGRDRA